MISIRRLFDHRSELLEQQPKNLFALAFGPAQASGVVVKDCASRAAFEGAARLVIEFKIAGVKASPDLASPPIRAGGHYFPNLYPAGVD